VKLTSVAIFAAGYVIGTRAGRERYAQIVDAVERTSKRLEDFSSRHTPDSEGERSGRADGGA
jgi:hypothetical protein